MIFLSQILHSIKRYFHPANSSFIFIITLAISFNFIFGALFYHFEHLESNISFMDALWWAMVTMTTVGYGDIYAKTTVGRFLISYPTMIFGIGIIGYLVGIVADFILEFSIKRRKGFMEVFIKNHIIICNYPGYDKFKNIIEEIREIKGHSKVKFVLIDDKLLEIPEDFKKNVFFIKGSPSDEHILHKANILGSAGVIVLNDNDQNNDDKVYTIGSLIELLEEEHKKPIKTILEVSKREKMKLMRRTNVDGLVTTDGLSSSLISQEFDMPGINKVISQLLTHKQGSELYLHKTQLEDCKIYDLQLAALQSDVNILILGLVHQDKEILNPSKEHKINKGDKLIILADKKTDISSIEALIKLKKG